MDPGVSTWAQIGRRYKTCYTSKEMLRGTLAGSLAACAAQLKLLCFRELSIETNEHFMFDSKFLSDCIHFFRWTHELETSSPNSWQRFSRKTPRIPMSSDRLYQVTPNSWLVQLFNSPEIMEIIDFFNDFLAGFLQKKIMVFVHWFLTHQVVGLKPLRWKEKERSSTTVDEAAPNFFRGNVTGKNVVKHMRFGGLSIFRESLKWHIWHGHVQQFFWDLHHQEKWRLMN